MASKHLSFRMPAEVFERLERQGRRSGRKRPDLITTYIDEGLCMEEHPGIVFRSGPAGRRPALVGGPDVWAVIRVINNVEGRGEEAITQAAKWFGMRREGVETAVRYYAHYKDEIDEWITRLDDEARRERALWEQRQQALA